MLDLKHMTRQSRKRTIRLLWVLGILVGLTIVAISLAPLWVPSNTLATILAVGGLIIALLSLLVTILPLLHSSSTSPKETTSASPRISSPGQDIPKPKELDNNDQFKWVTIPAGKVTLKDKSTFDGGTKGGIYDIPAFAIAKYPVTNAQYQKFVDAPDGYHEQSWWDYSGEANTWRNAHPQPKDTAFVGDNLPRTRVCWYDAVAFCGWISQHTGQTVTLPTEQQWQHAAQGDDHRTYPWGNRFDKTRCNASIYEKSTGPTPVIQYPTGSSPYQVMDLSGNVWEWCLNKWGTDSIDLRGSEQRAFRGGSWTSKSKDILRTAYRDKRNPDNEYDNVGFRCVRLQ